MRTHFPSTVVLALSVLCGPAPVRAADDYTLDPVHSCVSFRIQHAGISWIHGRFNDFSGDFAIDPNDPAKSRFAVTIKAESIDTNNKKRDDHLRSPDFFNVKQYPGITFKSTSVKDVDGSYEVTGDLTMHGETKPITFTLKGGKTAEFPKGIQRIGFWTDLSVKRAEFGMDKFDQMLGNEVPIAITFEAVKK